MVDVSHESSSLYRDGVRDGCKDQRSECKLQTAKIKDQATLTSCKPLQPTRQKMASPVTTYSSPVRRCLQWNAEDDVY